MNGWQKFWKGVNIGSAISLLALIGYTMFGVAAIKSDVAVGKQNLIDYKVLEECRHEQMERDIKDIKETVHCSDNKIDQILIGKYIDGSKHK